MSNEPLSNIDREYLRIGQELHRAASELPEGWEIEIRVEKGAGWVTLWDPDFEYRIIPNECEGLSYQITEAIRIATTEAQHDHTE